MNYEAQLEKQQQHSIQIQVEMSLLPVRSHYFHTMQPATLEITPRRSELLTWATYFQIIY